MKKNTSSLNPFWGKLLLENKDLIFSPAIQINNNHINYLERPYLY